MAAESSVLATSTTEITGNSITLSGNQATGRGGGIYSDSAVVIDGALSADTNTAQASGGHLRERRECLPLGSSEREQQSSQRGRWRRNRCGSRQHQLRHAL